MADDRTLQAEIDRYLAAYAKDPQGRAFAPLAEAYRKAGKVEEALRVVTEGMKIHPNVPGALATYGRCLLVKGDAAGAKVQLEKAVKLSPENLPAVGALAEVLEKLGDREGAAKTWRTLLLLNPTDTQAQNRLASLTAGGAGSPAAAEKGRADGFQVKPAGEAIGSAPKPAAPAAPAAGAPRPPAPGAAPGAGARPPAPGVAPRPAAPAGAPAAPPAGAKPPIPAPAAGAKPPVPAPVAGAKPPMAAPVPGAKPPMAAPVAGAKPPMPAPVAGARPPMAAPVAGAKPPMPAPAAAPKPPMPAAAVAPPGAARPPAPPAAAPRLPAPAAPAAKPPVPPPMAAPRPAPAAAAPPPPRPAPIPPPPFAAKPAVPAAKPPLSPTPPPKSPGGEAARPAVPPMPPTPAFGAPAAKPVSASAGPIPAAMGDEETTPLPPSEPSPIQTATMADLFVSQGHPEKAIPIYQKLLAANPNDAQARAKLADATAAVARPANHGGARERLQSTLDKVRTRRRAASATSALSGKNG